MAPGEAPGNKSLIQANAVRDPGQGKLNFAKLVSRALAGDSQEGRRKPREPGRLFQAVERGSPEQRRPAKNGLVIGFHPAGAFPGTVFYTGK